MSALSNLNSEAHTISGRVPLEDPSYSHNAPLPKGDRNENPHDIGLLALLSEDYRTYDRNLFDPGFWVVVIHRFGNARMGVRLKLLRIPLTIMYKLMFAAIVWLWGISLPYNTKLGRRVRIWHHGGIWLSARSIGDDVHIRHNTTIGLMNPREVNSKPIIGNRVDIGVGACILGAVTVGDDSVIGPNSVVIRDLPPGSAVMGVPARQTVLWKDGTTSPVTKFEGHKSGETNEG